MPPDQSDPKCRRLENSESGESVNVGCGSYYSGSSSHYQTPTAAATTQKENSFPRESHTPFSLPMLDSLSYCQSTATATSATACLPLPEALRASKSSSKPSFWLQILCGTSASQSNPSSDTLPNDPVRSVQDPQEVVCFGEVGCSTRQSTVVYRIEELPKRLCLW